MAVLNKPWGRTDRISPEESAVVTGDSTGEDADEIEPEVSDQPILVYVPDTESVDFCKAEKVVLQDDKVNVAMWAFKCVTMTDEAAKEDELLAKGEELPRFYVINRDYSKVKVIEGRSLSAKKLYTAMSSAANKAYKEKLDKNVKGMLKVLNEFDKINNARRVLEEKQKREGGEMDKKMERDLEELDEREKEAKEDEQTYKTFTLKT